MGCYEVEALLEVGMCKIMALMINLCKTLLLMATCVLLFLH